ncbi:MAG TPA: anti-sigma factor [Burkholderiales bacterium]|nr:anti-sigma factor [Burkholderiales bacterium]
MKYRNELLREALAAEYALGTLQGRARRRFERSLKDDPALRRYVASWQERLAPLDAALAPVQPPARVWRAIQRRTTASHARRGLGGLWDSLGFWRGAAFASLAAALILAASLGVLRPERPELMVVVMSDERAEPKMTVSWDTDDRGDKRMRIRVLGHAQMAPDTAWELWMLPGGDGKPRSLGLITTHATQSVVVPRELAAQVDAAWGLAMSVEPYGGSPTGLPTGPVLYKGQCTKL